MLKFLHNGDVGDCIAGLPAIRQLGGGKLIFTQRPNPRPFADTSAMLKPLFEAQPYIHSCEWQDDPEPVDFNLCTFRHSWVHNGSLAHMQAYHCGLKHLDTSPWFKVDPLNYAGRIIINRTPRYQNGAFPWKQVIEKYGDRLLFVGLPHEHADFQKMFSFYVEHHMVEDYLELARIIAGSDFFIGNQSSCCWVAMGLGHPLVQEGHAGIKDSVIPNPRAFFIRNSAFPFEKFK